MQKDVGIWVVSPSSYDDSGRLYQFSRLLMIPPIFGVMRALIYQVTNNLRISADVFSVNERTEIGETYIDKIIANKNYVQRAVFISAKTFEVPRAIDIARRFKRAGVEVVIGGIGVTLSDWRVCQLLQNEGISFNIGEGEETVPRIIEDIFSGRLQKCYLQKTFVDLSRAAFPDLPDKRGDGYKYALNPMAGVGTSEGCPRNCSFCSVTILRGRKMIQSRSRDPEKILYWVKKAHLMGLPVMFLDDNFRRSHNYRFLLQKLIVLNEKLKRSLKIFVQLDAAPDIISEISDLDLAGVNQAFLGIETFDLETLRLVGKKQNQPASYEKIIKKFHQHGILVDAGWMVGFPYQTPADIIKEAYLMADFDLVIPFRVVPFPCTKDYHEAVQNGEIIDWDLNNYDTNHFVRWLYHMTPETAQVAVANAFSIIYGTKHMLFGGSPALRVNVFLNNLYCRFIAEWGKRRIGRPYHVIMDGIPRPGHIVMRPKDSYKGVPLTPDDLGKRESFLEGLL